MALGIEWITDSSHRNAVEAPVIGYYTAETTLWKSKQLTQRHKIR